MAIGAYPDDIELNVGGSLLKYRDRGYEIVYIMSTNNMPGTWSVLRPEGRMENRTPPCTATQNGSGGGSQFFRD